MNSKKTTKITFVLVRLMTAFVFAIAGSARAVTWTQKEEMPTARWGLSTSVVDGKIYAIGSAYSSSSKKLEEYDPATDTWTEKADMPSSRVFVASVAVDGKIYVIGGETHWDGGTKLATVEEYDPATDTWTQKADMPTPRNVLGTSVVNGKIYAIGGGSTSISLKKVEEYDPATDTWTEKADMPTGRKNLSTSVVSGKIYAIGGGLPNGGAILSTVEVYDPTTDVWTKKANMPAPRSALSSSVVGDKIYAFGGTNRRGGSPFSTLFQYDPTTDTWTTEEDLPVRNLGMATSVVDNKIYVIGGTSASYPYSPPLSTVWEYDTGFTIPPDFNGDGVINSADVSILVDHWHTDNELFDIAPEPWSDGIVDVEDLVLLSEHLFEEVSDPTLVAHWALDETEGMTAHNNVSINDDFVIGGAFWQPDRGMVGGALELDGIDDCIISSTGINSADSPFSVVAWIKGGAPGQSIISQPGGVNWLMIDSEGNLMTELTGPGRSATLLFSEALIIDEQWHRIGFVWDDSIRMLYVDSFTVAQDIQDTIRFFGSGLYIGVGKDYAAGTFFSGLIDDVRIYNRVVSP
jgi:N-acetylneuraminic acid mutarotase